MHTAQSSDETHVAELAKRLREGTEPLCPQFRRCNLEGTYPVQGHCVLSRSPGWFMIPSIEEYRTYCTSRVFTRCHWFGQTGEGAEPLEEESGGHPVQTETWEPPEVDEPRLRAQGD